MSAISTRPQPSDVAAGLRRRVRGEVLGSDVDRVLYGSAACHYQAMPLCAVVPRDADDVQAVLAYVAEQGLSIVPRGAATGLAGQTVGPGIVLDLTKYLRGVENLGDGHVRVQPGVVLKALGAHLHAAGRWFPPDPSSGRSCTLGGMVATNAAGAHSVKYGTTKDFVRELDVVLADGSRRVLRPMPHPVDGDELLGRIDGVLRPAQELLARHWPQTNKSSCGYNLPEAWSAEQVDPTRLICGSEGTLAVVVGATLATLPLPPAAGSALVCVDRLAEVGEVVNQILAWQPSGLEILDRSLLQLLREHEAPALRFVPGDPDAVLLVEFDGAAEEVGNGLDRLQRGLGGRAGLSVEVAREAADQQRLWSIRHAANPILNRMPGRPKPITFIEDGVVAPERLPKYIAGLHDILERHSAVACVFGHAGNGHLHIKPILNLRDEADVARMESIAADACELLASLNGTLSGEHGDGLARTPLLRRLYGPVYPLFEQVKAIFDPAGRLNPGKIVAPAEGRRVTDDLRFRSDTPVVSTGTLLDEERWRLEMDKCHGCGVCRGYCPVFIATGDEAATARAKANLLRAVARGDLAADALYQASFKQVMDLCVGCQLCLTECPTQVDIPGLARLARTAYVERHGQTLQNRALAGASGPARWVTKVAPLANAVLGTGVVRAVARGTIGLAPERGLPPYSAAALAGYTSPNWDEATRQVVYFPGCYGQFHDPDGEGRAVIGVLETNGFAVKVPPGLPCCGIAHLTVGSEEAARRGAAGGAAILAPLLHDGVRLVASAASCGLALKTDWPELLGAAGEAVAERTVDIHELLLELHAAGQLDLALPPLELRVAYHEPCHLKAQPGAAGSAAKLLALLPGITLTPLTDSCCGIAGTFGMKTQHYELSMAMGRPLFDELTAAQPELVATGCGTCQLQVRQGTGLPVAHPVKLLWDAYQRRAAPSGGRLERT